MTTKPSNAFADKILAQHPLAMWSLDDESYYLTKIVEADRQLSAWNAPTGGTATTVTDLSAPFPSSYVTRINGTATPSSNADARVYLSSASTFSSNSFTISFYLKTQYNCSVSAGYGSGNVVNISSVSWNASYLQFTTSTNHGFSNGEYVSVSGVSPDMYDISGTIEVVSSNQFRIYESVANQGAGSGGQASGGKTSSKYINPADYPTDSWIPISFTFDDNALSQRILISFSYSQLSPQFFINGLTIGKDSQPFNGESLGQTLSFLPTIIATSVAKGIEAKSYGDEVYSAYYIGNGVKINTQTPTYSAPNITLSTSTAHGLSAGQTVTISGVTPAGYNGTWTTQSGTTGSTLVVNIGSNPGAITVGGNVSNNDELYAKNSGVSMCYGSNASTRIYPNTAINQPSFIFPAFGMLNQIGRYKTLTLQALIKLVANNSAPKRIIGPIASTDGIYVTKDVISLKIGDTIDSFSWSEMYKPMIMQFKIGNGFAKLSIDGQEIIALQIDNSTLSLPTKLDNLNRNQDWFGIYAYSDVPLIEVGSLAIYPYESSEAMAKVNISYAQAVSIPTASNSSLGQTISPDFALANYINNYNYPSFQARWDQATISDNLNIPQDNSLSAKKFIKPGTETSLYDSDKLFLDIYETYVASGESNAFINLKPSSVVSGSGRSWTTNQGYLSVSLSGENDYLSNCVYGVFKSLETSATKQILLKINNILNNNYFQISLTNTTVSYEYKYGTNSETQIATKSITQGTSFTVGFEVQKLMQSNAELFEFFSNKTNLQIFIGGQSTLTNTFSGNIYKVGFCSSRSSLDIASFFNSSGILSESAITINTQTPAISGGSVTITTATAHNFVVGDIVTISGLVPSGYNGNYTVTAVPTTTSFRFVNATTGNITTGGTVTRIFQSSLLSKIASYTVSGFNAFGKINLDVGTSGYWQDYIPLSKLAKTVLDESGNEVTALDFVQINLDYEEPRTYSSGNFVTSGLPIRGYVTFQTLSSGAKKDLADFTTLQSANANRTINASTFSSTTKYEFVNGTIVYPPTDVDISTLAIVLHLEFSTEASSLKPTKTRFLQLAAKSFNKNMPNKVGTKYPIDVYPYLYDPQVSNTAPTYPYNYNLQNPYLIYKERTPHLYLTRHSGFRVVGTLPTNYHRGIYANVGDNSSDKKITSIQMSLLADFESFSGTSKRVFSIKTSSTEIEFSTGMIPGSTTKAQITTNSDIPVVYYLNGRKVGRPVININEWNVLGISFVEPLNISNTQGRIFISSDILVNDISCHYANPTELDQKSSPLLWSQIDGNNWRIPVPTQTPTRAGNSITLTTTGDHNLVVGEKLTFYDIQPDSYGIGFGGGSLKISKVNSTSSFTYENSYAATTPITTAGTVAGTWEYANIPNYYSLYGNSPDKIYDEFTGRNKIVIDVRDDTPIMQINEYQYFAYVDVQTDTFILNAK